MNFISNTITEAMKFSKFFKNNRKYSKKVKVNAKNLQR